MKKLYIPFSKILKEVKKSTPVTFALYLCHRSATFENLWGKHKEEIKDLARTFLKEEKVDSSEVNMMNNVANLPGSCLFYGRKINKVDKAKMDFLVWGMKRNKLSRKNKLQST
jgi:hypothetical protein